MATPVQGLVLMHVEMVALELVEAHTVVVDVQIVVVEDALKVATHVAEDAVETVMENVTVIAGLDAMGAVVIIA